MHKLTAKDKMVIIRGLGDGEFPFDELRHLTGFPKIGKVEVENFPEIGKITLNINQKRALLKSVVDGVLVIEEIPGLLGELTILKFWKDVSDYDEPDG